MAAGLKLTAGWPPFPVRVTVVEAPWASVIVSVAVSVTSADGLKDTKNVHLLRAPTVPPTQESR